MKVNYLILKSKKPTVSIYYRFQDGIRFNSRRKLPIEIDINSWSSSKQEVKGKNIPLEQINKKLRDFKRFLQDEFTLAELNNELVNLDWVKRKQHDFFMRAKSNDDYKVLFKPYIEYYEELKGFSDARLTKVREEIDPKLRTIDIDDKWLQKFIHQELKKGYSENYIGKQIQLIRRVLKHAKNNGVRISESVYDIKKPTRDSIATYLNDDELNLLFNHTFDSERLENVKRLFLVGCTTGLRVSDLMKIQDHIIDEDFIHISKIIKTKQSLVIPIDPRVKDFIPLLKPISAQRFNDYIKEICETLKINELTEGYIAGKGNVKVHGVYPKFKLISSHTMRRSFATNLYGKVPTAIIRAITGHTSEGSLLSYIRKPQKEFADILKEYYNKR